MKKSVRFVNDAETNITPCFGAFFLFRSIFIALHEKAPENRFSERLGGIPCGHQEHGKIARIETEYPIAYRKKGHDIKTMYQLRKYKNPLAKIQEPLSENTRTP
jgi:hypothetical protein